MKTLLLVALVLVATLPTGCGVKDGSDAGTAELEMAVDALFSEWDVPGSPGGAVVLTHGGEKILMRCYGLASIEHGVPIKPATRFELASVSKPFTAFGVLLLEQEGELALSDDIQEYLPELPDYGSPITIADLLHQTSGISDWGRVRPYAGEYGNAGFEIEDLLDLVARQRVLEFEPGSAWSYSNTNYGLLAEIVARITGRPFGEWMHDNVFEPLEMHDTSFPDGGATLLPNRAAAYYRESGGEIVRSLVETFEIPGPAHCFSTVQDMARWLDNLRTGRVGGIDLIHRMMERPTLTTGEQSFYGAGVGMVDYRGVLTVGHSGQTGAFKSELVYCPDLDVGVAILGNAGWMQAYDISRRILDIYLAGKLEPLPAGAADASSETDEIPTYDLDPSEYGPFLGGYRLDTDPSVLLAVAREGEWLVGVLVGEGLGFFRPVGPTEFENRHRNCHLAFLAGEKEQGTFNKVVVTLRGEEMQATRAEMSENPGWVDQCIGFYYSDELEAVYEIVREPDGLAVRAPGSGARPLEPADTDILAGGIGVLTFLRGDQGEITGFDFGEPEDLGNRQIRFARFEQPD
jgi:CubicO group peptidase (beta-lactamase class C family)